MASHALHPMRIIPPNNALISSPPTLIETINALPPVSLALPALFLGVFLGYLAAHNTHARFLNATAIEEKWFSSESWRDRKGRLLTPPDALRTGCDVWFPVETSVVNVVVWRTSTLRETATKTVTARAWASSSTTTTPTRVLPSPVPSPSAQSPSGLVASALGLVLGLLAVVGSIIKMVRNHILGSLSHVGFVLFSMRLKDAPEEFDPLSFFCGLGYVSLWVRLQLTVWIDNLFLSLCGSEERIAYYVEDDVLAGGHGGDDNDDAPDDDQDDRKPSPHHDADIKHPGTLPNDDDDKESSEFEGFSDDMQPADQDDEDDEDSDQDHPTPFLVDLDRPYEFTPLAIVYEPPNLAFSPITTIFSVEPSVSSVQPSVSTFSAVNTVFSFEPSVATVDENVTEQKEEAKDVAQSSKGQITPFVFTPNLDQRTSSLFAPSALTTPSANTVANSIPEDEEADEDELSDFEKELGDLADAAGPYETESSDEEVDHEDGSADDEAGWEDEPVDEEAGQDEEDDHDDDDDHDQCPAPASVRVVMFGNYSTLTSARPADTDDDMADDDDEDEEVQDVDEEDRQLPTIIEENEEVPQLDDKDVKTSDPEVQTEANISPSDPTSSPDEPKQKRKTRRAGKKCTKRRNKRKAAAAGSNEAAATTSACATPDPDSDEEASKTPVEESQEED